MFYITVSLISNNRCLYKLLIFTRKLSYSIRKLLRLSSFRLKYSNKAWSKLIMPRIASWLLGAPMFGYETSAFEIRVVRLVIWLTWQYKWNFYHLNVVNRRRKLIEQNKWAVGHSGLSTLSRLYTHSCHFSAIYDFILIYYNIDILFFW